MHNNSIHHIPNELHTNQSWQSVADRISGTFVVLVTTDNDRLLRRCYKTLASAERAARKARSRGQSSTVVLSELHPLYRVPSHLIDGAS